MASTRRKPRGSACGRRALSTPDFTIDDACPGVPRKIPLFKIIDRERLLPEEQITRATLAVPAYRHGNKTVLDFDVT